MALLEQQIRSCGNRLAIVIPVDTLRVAILVYGVGEHRDFRWTGNSDSNHGCASLSG
jgi:hypothetical protein